MRKKRNDYYPNLTKHFKNAAEIGAEIDLHANSVNEILNGKREFTIAEKKKLLDCMCKSYDQMDEIFYSAIPETDTRKATA